MTWSKPSAKYIGVVEPEQADEPPARVREVELGNRGCRAMPWGLLA